MKLGAVTKIDKGNKITSKKKDNYVISANFDVIVIFLSAKNAVFCKKVLTSAKLRWPWY